MSADAEVLGRPESAKTSREIAALNATPFISRHATGKNVDDDELITICRSYYLIIFQKTIEWFFFVSASVEKRQR